MKTKIVKKSKILDTIVGVLMVLSLVSTLPIYSQEDDSPHCDEEGGFTNSSLKLLFSKERDSIDIFLSDHPFAGGLSTSILIPESGKPIHRPNEPEYSLDEAGYNERYKRWSCKYSPDKAWDKNPATAWVEGAKGHGIGEILLVTGGLDLRKEIEIWGGYGKSKTLYKANNRPKKLRVALTQTEDSPDMAQVGMHHSGLKIVSENIVELKDVNGFQRLPIKKIRKVAKGFPGEFLVLEILEVYEGSKYQDTAISEIRNVEGSEIAMAEESNEQGGKIPLSEESSSTWVYICWVIWVVIGLGFFLIIFFLLKKFKK